MSNQQRMILFLLYQLVRPFSNITNMQNLKTVAVSSGVPPTAHKKLQSQPR